MVGEEINLGIVELNTMAKNLGHVTIDFLHMFLYEFYVIQNVVVMEMKVREGALIKQVHTSNKTVSNMKKTIKETEEKAKTWEEEIYRLDNVVTLAFSNFVDEGITNEMFAEATII